MTCQEMDFRGGSRSPEVLRHLAECDACRALAAALEAPTQGVDRAALEGVRAQIFADLKPVRPLAPVSAFAGIFLFAAGVLACATASLKGFYGPPALSAVQGTAILGALGALLVWAAYTVALGMRPGARVASGVKLFAVALGVMELAFLALFHDYTPGRFVHWGLGCFRMGIACAAVTALAASLAVRRGYVVARVSTGAAIGGLAGLAGLAALELHCPILNVPHLAIWHAGVLVASAGIGAAVGRVAR